MLLISMHIVIRLYAEARAMFILMRPSHFVQCLCNKFLYIFKASLEVIQFSVFVHVLPLH